ncbi:hypothetical protein CPHO_09420 [Corynebacterium phocae]|uniref:TOMM leader peptide-binding protein n=1 Tax=Corynebacterium phocae TaxID=161895 RepID=A0A1L7D4T1_9CORY|nr:hypothetical protein [Corynebacterium phocae]APT93067.1 hypothetical protein CPHO_09420 [Corynebacterium phocae]KAA8722368.1 hypothetical protein F4V58_08890 [Corynebacterium phocae]
MTDSSIRLAPGVSFLAREVDLLQFGLDATRAGAISVEKAAAVAAALQLHPRTTTVSQLTGLLVTTGLTPAAAALLVGEFLDFGLWYQPPPPAAVEVVGKSPLAYSVFGALKSNGFAVRMRPHPIIEDDPRPIPVFAVDSLYQSHILAANAHRRQAIIIPVTGFDTRVVLGPLRKNKQGACPACFNLFRAEIDPRWDKLLQASENHWPELDPLVVTAAQIHVVALARFLTGAPLLPGSTPTRWMPGETQEIDVFGRNLQRFIEPHPRCLFCAG